ncbi:MAG: hypothetical protein IPI67_00720 [Myxococcales bacterium]|nr:hypothetical protein [Myxococcales bacterium]
MTASDAPPLLRPERHWLYPLLGWLSFAVPLFVTLSRVSAFTQWRDDLPIVRALGLVPIGGEGTLSSVLMQAASLLPLGGRVLRAALPSAVCLAIAARLLFALTARLLEQNAWTPRLIPWLSFAAALTATLAPTWQLEGTIAGGSTLAAALVLGGLLLRPSADTRDARVWLGFGAFIGLTTMESHTAGGALVVALAMQVFALGELPPRRGLALCAGGAALVIVLCVIPLAVRPFAVRSWVHLGYTISSASVSGLDAAAEQSGVLATWFSEVGLIACALALGGLVWGLVRGRTRWIAVPLGALIVADVVFPASRAGLLSADSLTPLRLLSLSALAAAAALGVHTVAVTLQRSSVPMARYAAWLLVAFDFTLVLVTAEDSGFPADRTTQNAAEVWTDEALGALPHRSLLLVRSETVAWRLWAARVARGERPDVVVVPLPLLSKGSVASKLLALEPGLAPLIRDMAVNGEPSEGALSSLADLRPLYVELDPAWDRRLVDHLIPRPFWLHFAPHAFGRSDRTVALEKGRRPFRRVLAAAQTPDYRDRATITLLSSRAEEQATVLAQLGDRESVAELVADLREIDPAHPFARELEARLKKHPKGGVDVSDLIQ